MNHINYSQRILATRDQGQERTNKDIDNRSMVVGIIFVLIACVAMFA